MSLSQVNATEEEYWYEPGIIESWECFADRDKNSNLLFRLTAFQLESRRMAEWRDYRNNLENGYRTRGVFSAGLISKWEFGTLCESHGECDLFFELDMLRRTAKFYSSSKGDEPLDAYYCRSVVL